MALNYEHRHLLVLWPSPSTRQMLQGSSKNQYGKECSQKWQLCNGTGLNGMAAAMIFKASE
eukprot:2488175-Amphidinium_carterae.1